MDDKKFMTYDEQICFLENAKNLIIDNRESALALLKRHSYFALINGYKHPFKGSDGSYKSNTRIEDIHLLYLFDNRIRYVLMQSIMDVEIHIKSLLSYAFSEKYGEEESAYLAATNYNYDSAVYQGGIDRLIQILTDTLNDYESYPYMKHQKEQHGNIPLWVLVKALTLGNISKMYSYQNPQIQTKISKEFSEVTEGDLSAFLDLLTRFRNVCAHNERLFDYRYNKRSINNMRIHREMNIPKKRNRYIKGKSDFFAALISLKYLLTREKFDKLVNEISDAIDQLVKSTSQIKREQLYKYMGLPDDWHRLKLIQLK